MSALSAGSAAVALAEGEIFEDDNDEELNKTKPQKQRVVVTEGGDIGGHNEAEDDSLEYEDDENARLLDVCIDGDVEDLVALLEEMAANGETLNEEMLNYPDQSGRTPASHLCGNGMIEMLEMLEDVPLINYNLADNEGNAPLHLAAQAGHVDVVSFLLNKVRTIVVDPVNNLGFSPLMKAALQGRIKCSKLLLFSGASPIRRDPGRHFTAAQWARYCGRVVCADSIDKFVRTAVPGGDAALAAAGSSDLKHGGHGGLHGGGPGGGAGGKGGKSGGPFRSKSTGSRHKAGWLSRKLKKAFHHGSHEDLNDGGGRGDGGDHLSSSAPASESPMSHRRHSHGSGKKGKSQKFSVPQVHVTKECAGSDEDSEEEAAAVRADESGIAVIKMVKKYKGKG